MPSQPWLSDRPPARRAGGWLRGPAPCQCPGPLAGPAGALRQPASPAGDAGVTDDGDFSESLSYTLYVSLELHSVIRGWTKGDTCPRIFALGGRLITISDDTMFPETADRPPQPASPEQAHGSARWCPPLRTQRRAPTKAKLPAGKEGATLCQQTIPGCPPNVTPPRSNHGSHGERQRATSSCASPRPHPPGY